MGVDVTVGVGDGSVPVGVIDGVSVMVGVGAPVQVMLRRSIPGSKKAMSELPVMDVSVLSSSICPSNVHVKGNTFIRPKSATEGGSGLTPVTQPAFSRPGPPFAGGS
jgi:hypothetical protein